MPNQLFLLSSSFFQSSLTQMSCCRTWIHPTSPAIATTTFYRSSKTTEAIQTHKNFSDCLQFPWEPRAVAQYLINTKMHSLSLLPLVQFSLASTDWLKEVKTPKTRRDWGGSLRPPTPVAILLNCAAILSRFFFLRHTQVYVCTLGTSCSIFYSWFVSFWEEKRISLYKTEKITEKKPALSGQCGLCPYCYSNLRGHGFLVSQLHSLTGLVSRTVMSTTHHLKAQEILAMQKE